MKHHIESSESIHQSTSANNEINQPRRVLHGLSRTPEYKVWKGIRRRCNNKNEVAWPDYGGRGIVMCKGWTDFTNFLADMGPRHSDLDEIDRIDNNSHYSCGHCEECITNGWTANCRWTTRKEQSRNTRANRMIEFMGQKKCMAGWAETVGISNRLLWFRLNKGWTLRRALTEPVNEKYITLRNRKRQLTQSELQL